MTPGNMMAIAMLFIMALVLFRAKRNRPQSKLE